MPEVSTFAQLQTLNLPPEALRVHSPQYFILARRLLVRSPLDAVDLLAHVLSAMEAAADVGGQIEALLLLARAHRRLGNAYSTKAALISALELAGPEGDIQRFLDEEDVPFLISDLQSLIQRQGSVPQLVYNDRSLSASDLPASSQIRNQKLEIRHVIEPLSDRERDILRLIADGLSNQEIAQKMIVAVSTIKWHINHLYAKLDAHSRTQALARAKELGLL